MRVRTGVGVIELRVWHGQDRRTKRWGCPIRKRWGFSPHQVLSPWLQERLAFTVTQIGSYEGAAAMARNWGYAGADDSSLHALTQRLGAQAEAQTQQRLKKLPQEREPKGPASELAVFMLDGWQVRQRGPGWGKKKTQKTRVEWHELKTGVFYFQEQACRAGERGVLTDKVVISWQGSPVELGERLHYEAMRRGLSRAQAKVVVADGALWIWNVVADRWAGASEVLDFYHASEHLWSLGRALVGEAQARFWVEPRLHQLRHGQQKQLLQEIAALEVPASEAGEVVAREQNYFASQAQRMKYREFVRAGYPIGSGAVESACKQRQGRFKRPGQFWTERGLRHLCALEEARYNGHWDQLSFAQ
jgi:hypothetical protein